MATTADLVDEVTFDVERGKIREFARATFAVDPVYTDRQAAVERKFPDVVATPTYAVVTAHHRNQREWVLSLGLDIARVVMGSSRWEYRRPFVVGDCITATRRVLNDEQKQASRGSLRILTLETEYTDDEGSIVLVQRDVVIERPKP
jgi:acyl dehydratase